MNSTGMTRDTGQLTEERYDCTWCRLPPAYFLTDSQNFHIFDTACDKDVPGTKAAIGEKAYNRIN
jgi:hypothetical protein